MKSLEQLCTPRKSVFDLSRRDVVLDISNFIAGTTDAFFEDNYLTDGMNQLLRESYGGSVKAAIRPFSFSVRRWVAAKLTA